MRKKPDYLMLLACFISFPALADMPPAGDLQPLLPQTAPAASKAVPKFQLPREPRYFPLSRATLRSDGSPLKQPYAPQKPKPTALPGAPLTHVAEQPMPAALQTQTFHDIFDAE